MSDQSRQFACLCDTGGCGVVGSTRNSHAGGDVTLMQRAGCDKAERVHGNAGAHCDGSVRGPPDRSAVCARALVCWCVCVFVCLCVCVFVCLCVGVVMVVEVVALVSVLCPRVGWGGGGVVEVCVCVCGGGGGGNRERAPARYRIAACRAAFRDREMVPSTMLTVPRGSSAAIQVCASCSCGRPGGSPHARAS